MLPAGAEERDVVAAAAARGLALRALATHGYYSAGSAPDGRGRLVVDYAGPPEHLYAAAVAALVEALAAGLR